MDYQSENRICQNCKKDFIIEPDDFSFYEKIKVPPPTFCPQCRFVRRLITKNERVLYKRKCDLCDKKIISTYDEDSKFPVYCPECFRGDGWETSEYNKSYDSSKSFFLQWKELFNIVPRQSLWQLGSTNSEYANLVYYSKNVYLSYSVLTGSEDVFYSNNIDNSKQIFDSYNINDGELNYQNINGVKNYNCQYSYWSSNCINCNFILDCNNCQDCFGCVNMINKRFCILNKQYTKEQYEEELEKMDIGSNIFVEKFKKAFWNFSLRIPRKFARMINAVDSTGDEIRNSKNVKYSFNCYGNENIKYAYRCPKAKDSIDVTHSYAENSYEHAYGGSENSQNIKFVMTGIMNMSDSEYIDSCQSSSNLFGCIGLKNKHYCILNKQYTKDEYFQIVEKIKKDMNDIPYIDSGGRIYKYGEFFPYDLCPYGYNESIINDYFPLSKKEIIEKGYPYKEKVENNYTVTLKARDIPDNIKDINDSILNEVIECEKSGKAFRITPFELQFYRRMNIPIPHLHPDERYKERLSLRNPMILYHRKCMNKGCTNEFETSYAPDRPEIVYCDSCYKKEVY